MIGYWHSTDVRSSVCPSVCLSLCDALPCGAHGRCRGQCTVVNREEEHFLFTSSDTFAVRLSYSHKTQRSAKKLTGDKSRLQFKTVNKLILMLTMAITPDKRSAAAIPYVVRSSTIGHYSNSWDFLYNFGTIWWIKLYNKIISDNIAKSQPTAVKYGVIISCDVSLRTGNFMIGLVL